jgi:putative transcriptional regulator
MPVRFKIDVLAELKKKGFSSYKMRQEKLMGEATIQQLRKGELVSWENIGRICAMLDCQPGDILEYAES